MSRPAGRGAGDLSPRRRVFRALRDLPGFAGLGLVALLLAACGAGAGAPTAPRTPAPFAGARLYVDPQAPAARQVREWRAAGRDADADRLGRMATQPTAHWLDGQQRDVTADVLTYTAEATAAGTWPVLVLYNVPSRDCGHYSGGGATTDQGYYSWVGQVAAGLGEQQAIVVLEPDGVAQAVSGCAGLDPAARFRNLSTAVDILREQTAAQVYLDAGHAGWVADLDALAAGLTASGIARTAGFALNVSNFQTTEASTQYGDALSGRVGGRPYVVDTSRNGAGPPPSELAEAWCNPPDRRLGADPTTVPPSPLVDALLWVKPPGTSDGPCRGAPAAGEWSADLALGLAG